MIISASRRTDIPAFYTDWFMNRIAEGYVLVRNPMNPRQISRVSLDPCSVDCIVFWTKNPDRMIDRLKVLDERNIPYYFQFSLTPYGKEIEPNVPDKNEIISTFITLSGLIGKERVIWRYDPIIITPDLGSDYHRREFESLARTLGRYTQKCVISFVDFYAKCRTRLARVSARDIPSGEMRALAEAFSEIGRANALQLETCAESIGLTELGIHHGKCIDNELIARLTGRPLEFRKDPVQRELCGCAASVDIGDYNMCSHNCVYCYASQNSETITAKMSQHKTSSPLLSGTIQMSDKITLRE